MTGALASNTKSDSSTYAATNRSPEEVLLYVCDFHMMGRHLIPHPTIVVAVAAATSGSHCSWDRQQTDSCFVLFSVPQ
jgi:hypothetical protein